ncbi:MAG TPA: GntR family transcriptional regulator [Candidatus Limnocylindrales bacterium]
MRYHPVQRRDAHGESILREPLHSIIASRAEERIRSGEWPAGSRLPPERELCRLFDASRATLRHALGELERRGLITRHQGRGTFVTRPRVATDLSGFFSISTALRARGMQLTTRVVEVAETDAGRQLAQELGILPGDRVVRLERLRSVEAEPLVLETAHLPSELFPGLAAKDFVDRSLYDVLFEDYGRRASVATETLEPVILTPRESQLLGVPRHAPAILTQRITVDAGGTIVESAQAILRGDRARFLLQRRVLDPLAGNGAHPAAPTPSTPAGSLEALS